MSNTSKITTIKVSISTREELKNIGKKMETYDEILKRLITFYREKGGEKT